MRRFAFVALCMGIAGGPPAAAEPADTAPAAPKICKKAMAPTGSRLGARKICATKKEWRAYVEPGQRETRNSFDLMQKRAVLGDKVGGGGG